MEFHKNFLQLRRMITEILLKDFNTDSKFRKINENEFQKKMNMEDFETFNSLLKKYSVNKMIFDYPSWYISETRKNILRILQDISKNITLANSIYPISISECIERRKYQNISIGLCFTLLTEFQFIVSMLSCDIEKYAEYIKLIETEIKLLKGWRKSTNKFEKSIKDDKENSERKISEN